jgi:hypothetical protein
MPLEREAARRHDVQADGSIVVRPDGLSLEWVENRDTAEGTVAPAWADPDGSVDVVLNGDDLEGLRDGTFSPASDPGQHIEVNPAIEKQEPWGTTTFMVRLRRNMPCAGLCEAQAGWLKVALRKRRMPRVSEAAIQRAPDGGAFVFMMTPGSPALTVRRVQPGSTHAGSTAVISGLADGERIVGRDAFFVAAEQTLRVHAAAKVF